MANRVNKRNIVLKALTGTNWGQLKETLLLTYKALGRSIANYAEPVWSTNASDTSLEKIQCTQNEALRIITGSHKMSSIDHLYSETKMILVKDHLKNGKSEFTVFWACRPCGPAGWLARLLTKADDVETNPGPTTLNKKVWICDICHKVPQDWTLGAPQMCR